MDIVTLAMNMVCHGVDPKLDFSNIAAIREKYERFTRMRVYERTPYAGDLVFTAFSGSHQDAISKGMAWREAGKSGGRWDVPYLPIDPKDVGREYESDVIRINSQSGKGGVAFVLKQNFGMSLPDKMKEEVGYLIKGVSDHRHEELTPDMICLLYTSTDPIFQEYLDQYDSDCEIKETSFGFEPAETPAQAQYFVEYQYSNGVSDDLKYFYQVQVDDNHNCIVLKEGEGQAEMETSTEDAEIEWLTQ